MPRWRLSIFLNILLILLAALLGLASDYLANATDVPAAFRMLQQWSLPLAGITLALIIGVQVWLHVLERSPSPKRMWDSSRPPYPGLEAFVEQDAGVFFGRDAEIGELYDRLHPTVADHAQRFVAVIGPSGVGKSSLVHAGLLPRLAQRRSRWVIIPSLVPEAQPIRRLAQSLAAALPGTDVDTLAADLSDGPTALVRYVERLRTAHDGRAVSVLLVIDQAEELLTLTGEQERLSFLALLRAALQDDPRLWVVATLRSEFLTGFLTTDFAFLFRNPVAIGALDRGALFQVIEQPAAQAGLTFAPGVVNELVDDTGGGDALPLLAYTLQALYLQAGPGGTVTAEDYRRLGGVAATLSRQADKVSAELQTASATPVLSTLLKFVTVDEAGSTRRRVQRSALSDAERRVADAFITARLLTSDAEGDNAVIRVAHEALFRQWAPLRQAIEARTDDLRQRAELERWAQDWVRSGRRDSYLLRDERLRIAQQWAAAQGDNAVELPHVQEFLERSHRSDRAAMERLSEAVAKQALAAIDSDPEQGVLLALAAVEECAPTPLAHRALLAAVAACRVRCVLRGHRDMVLGVAWSPDGQRLATASGDHTAQIWDTKSGAQLAVLRGHRDRVWSVAWAPDGTRLATASHDHTARIWDAHSGTELAVLRGHQNAVRCVASSPDGRRLATCSRDRTARIWDVDTGTELAVLSGHENAVRDVAWSPDGKRLATSSRDRTARIWDVETGTELAVLHGHQDWVQGMEWSPDGRRLATGSHDRTVRIWDAVHGIQLAVLRGHQDGVFGVAWSPDGQQLAASSHDRTARVWDPDTGAELAVFRGHQNTVLDVAWSPDGQQLATGSYDCTVRIWDATADPQLAALRGHQDGVFGVAWSPDGRRLVTGSFDCTVRIWDARANTELAVLHGHPDAVRGVAWSPDGQRVATGSDDCTARIWHVDTATEIAVLRGHRDPVLGVAWSPDGQHLATASHDHTARIWDPVSGVDLAILRDYTDAVRDVAWSPDGNELVTGSDDRIAQIWIWDAVHSTKSTLLCGHEDWVVDAEWSPNGRCIATASLDRTARIWDAASGIELVVLPGHQDAVSSLSWSPDDRCIATASLDRTARIWDAASGIELAVLRGHQDAIRDVAWSPDGKRLATGSDDCTTRVWNVAHAWDAVIDLDALVAKARTRVFRELTDDERRSVMLPEVAEPQLVPDVKNSYPG